MVSGLYALLPRLGNTRVRQLPVRPVSFNTEIAGKKRWRRLYHQSQHDRSLVFLIDGMFSLLYGLWEYVFRKEELRVLILGLDKAGKTTLLEKLKELCTGEPGLDPQSIVPTVGLNVGRAEAHHALLLFWDLGGAAGLRSIWDKYYADSHALIYAVDSTQPARFEEARTALFRALDSRELFGVPLLVLANKQDLQDAQPPEAVQQMLGLDELKVPFRVQDVSALTGDGLRDGLQWLVDKIRKSDRAVLLRQRL